MKLVNEFLYKNKIDLFTQDSDPIYDMGIGIKPKIEKWLKTHNIYKYKLSKRILDINVFTSVFLDKLELNDFPSYINFNHIIGGFHIKHNYFKFLRGCPYSLTGSFIASNNELKDLIDSPHKVYDNYAASNNKLESLKGITQNIGKSIYLNDNKLKNLKYLQKYIKGNLYIYNNPIETLEHFPFEIEGHLKFTPSDVLSIEKIKKICKVWGHIIELK